MKLKNNLFKINKIEDTDQGRKYSITLLADCKIYQAHFPGQPVTPGVCILQIAKELLEEEYGMSYEISDIKNVKFLYILSPKDDPDVVFTLTKVDPSEDHKTVSAKMEVTNAAHHFASISFTCQAQ